MKYLKFIIGLILFIGMILLINKTGAKAYEEQNKVLKNGVAFEGIVTDIKRSDNHGFGILTLRIYKSSVDHFSDTLKEGIYPYRIRGEKAEIYLPIFAQRKIGDSVKLISDKGIIYYKGGKSSDQGEVYIITLSTDIDFVKENTMFRE